MTGGRMLRALPAALLFAVVVAGCGGVESLSFHSPPPTKAPSGTTPLTLPGNLASMPEAGVPGAATTTVPVIGPGKASITGSVFGPGGPVGGATVLAERLVGDRVASTTATTAADGSFTIANVLGGRYRLRAWHSPDLAMTTPQIFFLDSGQPHGTTLQLSGFNGPDVATSVNPGVMNVGGTANLLVQVMTPTVGNDGIVRDQPLVGATVTLTNGPSWTVQSANPQTTGTNGRALFQISCSQAGDNSLSVAVGSAPAQPVATPACVAPPPPTTACTSTTTTFSQPFQTTTTQPQSAC